MSYLYCIDLRYALPFYVRSIAPFLLGLFDDTAYNDMTFFMMDVVASSGEFGGSVSSSLFPM